MTWEETISDNREPYLMEGRVDLVLASYSITDERRPQVGQTGPYFLTGQQVLVRADSDVTGIEDLAGVEVCSVTGSTSLSDVEAAGRDPGAGGDLLRSAPRTCSTARCRRCRPTGSILLGLAARNPEELKVVGEEFSEERIGVGYSLDHPEMCEWINGVLTEAFENGDWEDAFEATLGVVEGVEPQDPPALDECPAA